MIPLPLAQTGVMSNGPSITHKKSKKKKKKVKSHHQGSTSVSLCALPPSSPQQVHNEVVEQGEEALEIINIGKCKVHHH